MKPDEKTVKLFENDRFATENGAVIEEVEEHYAQCSLKLGSRHRNAMGAVMGGVYFTLADFAFAVAANWQGTGTVSLHSDIAYLGSAKGNQLIAEAVCIKNGRSTSYYKIEVKDELGNLAYGLDKMRRTLIIKEDNEQKMKESQNSLVLAMAHDLRTPLTSLITFLEIALKKSKDIENTECLKKCYKKADQIRELTDQLFDFFLIQKKEKVELEPSANAEYAIGEYLSEFSGKYAGCTFGSR